MVFVVADTVEDDNDEDEFVVDTASCSSRLETELESTEDPAVEDDEESVCNSEGKRDDSRDNMNVFLDTRRLGEDELVMGSNHSRRNFSPDSLAVNPW